jgi:hypothetical protein
VKGAPFSYGVNGDSCSFENTKPTESKEALFGRDLDLVLLN